MNYILLLNQNTSQLAAGMNGSHKNFPQDTPSALLRSSSFMPHTPLSELEKRKKDLAKYIEIGKTYHHYKNSEVLYKVLDIGFNESNEKVCVLYYNIEHPEVIFIRPVLDKKGWLSPVEIDGKTISRFTLILSD